MTTLSSTNKAQKPPELQSQLKIALQRLWLEKENETAKALHYTNEKSKRK